MLFLIVGKSASGKDTIADELEARGLTRVISRTDREPRFEGEGTHLFVSHEVAEEESGRAAAATKIAGINYYALPEDIEGHDVYIIDPQGVRDLCRNLPDTTFHVVYVEADDDVRRTHAIARADDPELAARLFDERNAKESPDFDEFRLLCTDQTFALPQNVTCVTVHLNDYEPSSAAGLAERLVRYKRRFEGVMRMICDLSRYDIFDIDEDNHFKGSLDGEDTRISLEQACASFLADNEQLAELTRSWLGHRDDVCERDGDN